MSSPRSYILDLTIVITYQLMLRRGLVEKCSATLLVAYSRLSYASNTRPLSYYFGLESSVLY